uniref:Uncharacterized protein n=1 Tax=Anguilla anguilla TaxID=7936 RepID=A0A0E9QI91_ANGAN
MKKTEHFVHLMHRGCSDYHAVLFTDSVGTT